MSTAATKTYALPGDIEVFPLEFRENLKELLQKSYKLYREVFLVLKKKRKDSISALGTVGCLTKMLGTP